MKYIQFYDDNGLEILGSDGIFLFDNRLSLQNAIQQAAKHAWEMLGIRPISYCKVFSKPIGRGHCVKDTVMLIDPTDARNEWIKRRGQQS